jgi:Tfp pilus assembly protein PilV
MIYNLKIQRFLSQTKNYCKLKSGQSLAELLIAMGVFVVGVVTVAFLVLEASISSRQGIERTKALLLAKEGLEAARSIRDADFDNLPTGNHGIILSGNKWIFSGSSDNQDQFTRTINITDVDVDTKKVESTIIWQFTGARQDSLTLTDYFTDWSQTHGSAGEMNVDISGTTLSGDNKELQGITIENIDTEDIVIDKIAVWWEGTSTLHQIRIDDTDVFSVSPEEGVSSGAEVDITNFTLNQDLGVKDINTFKFNGLIIGTDFMIKFIMTDSSTNYVLVDL